MKKFDELVRVFDKLHSKNGCKWDKSQTHESLLKYLKEETKEFIDAVNSGNSHHMAEELGDILLQIMFHAQIAKKNKEFDVEDVIVLLIKKLKRRHPHVFAAKSQESLIRGKKIKLIIANWRRIKKTERLKHGK